MFRLVSLLVAAGIAVFVGSVSTYNSLRSACDDFYTAARFPRIFVSLKRAPLYSSKPERDRGRDERNGRRLSADEVHW